MELHDKNGMVYVTALAIMLILLLIGAAAIFIARSDIRIGNNEMAAMKAFYAAESGVEHVIADIQQNGIPNVTAEMPFEEYSWDINNDGELYYVAELYPGETTIVSTGFAYDLSGAQIAERTVEVEYQYDLFTGVMQSGLDIRFWDDAPISAEIIGNIDARGELSKGNEGNEDTSSRWLISSGKIRRNNGKLVLPDIHRLQFDSYKGIPDAYIYTESQMWPSLPQGEGIYFIEGDLRIAPGSGNGFTANNTTLIATGNVDFSVFSAGGLIINAGQYTPERQYPAVVAGKKLAIYGAGYMNISGLLYGREGIYIDYSFQDRQSSIRGALISNGKIHWINTVDNLTLVYPDEGINPPFFESLDANGEPDGRRNFFITSWQGHESVE